ncbi:hypothetical protein MKZ38_006163 [Zalerion maritima]|uniref:Uncharacterized protein n=1 Tax=Zalerion maritima TaxID=339359 RepID=A0AAD5RK92_9PEZI|nr:hypothetical protein MKZ38_006163 [Zalerion maritima]
MAPSTRKGSKAAKATEAPGATDSSMISLSSPVRETPTATTTSKPTTRSARNPSRRSSARLASKRESENGSVDNSVIELVSSDHEKPLQESQVQAQENEELVGPTPTKNQKQKKLPVRVSAAVTTTATMDSASPAKGREMKVEIEIPIVRAIPKGKGGNIIEVGDSDEEGGEEGDEEGDDQQQDKTPNPPRKAGVKGRNNKKQHQKQKQEAVEVPDSASDPEEGEDEFHDADEQLFEEAIEKSEYTVDKHVAAEEETSTSKPTAKSKRKNKDKATTSSNPTESRPMPKAAAAKKILFDDSYDFSAAAEIAKTNADSKHIQAASQDTPSDDDEDEGPEEETILVSKPSADLAKKTAQKAAEEKAALQRKKRQERDALFKNQAEEKRKAKLALAAISSQKEDGNTAAKDVNMVMSRVDTETAAPLVPVPSGRKRHAHTTISSTSTSRGHLLPAELLTDSDLESSPSDPHDVPLPSRAKQPKKDSFPVIQSRQDKQSRKRNRDERVGDTVYRVSKKLKGDDLKLPPKIMNPRNGGREHKRELMGRGRRSGGVPTVASPGGGGKKKGFFKK